MEKQHSKGELDLVRHLDGILVQLEDSGAVVPQTVREARAELVAQGWNEKRLHQLADDKLEGLEIHRLLVVSLSHLSQRAALLLGRNAEGDRVSLGRGIHSDKFLYGFHLTLAEDDPEEQWIDDSVRDIVQFARQHGCTHVRIDNDGPEVSSLRKYE